MAKDIVALLLLLLPLAALPAPDTGFVEALCNVASFTAGDPFTESLSYVLADLVTVASARAGHDYYNISPYPNAFAYGHASCSGNLTAGDCADCLHAAVRAVSSACPMKIGGRAVLRDCAVRYEKYPFV
ncbi:Antifungal protein ginkbilobin-2 [Apostasia shenzhenica]|uniref:Antifungal protein ginkbilobin-2 n=1 Tax=Apostasia shenzhenica TaxID=1088818 RepID=A0A2I0BB74_9ASPA|nr:Antifungal protein ginkbilobin-2 [Apostasia shenzhenica]